MWTRRWWLPALALLAGCLINGDLYKELEAGLTDADEDGHPASVDCDDDDPSTHPGAEERCDGVDNDCNFTVDDPVPWYKDADQDSFGDPEVVLEQCEQPEGYTSNNLDCDDGNAAAYPGAASSSAWMGGTRSHTG